MAIDTRTKLDLANEENCNEYEQEKERRREKAIETSAIKLTHKSNAFQELFKIAMYNMLDFSAERWYNLEDKGLYEDDAKMNYNFAVAIIVRGGDSDREKHKEAVLRCVPKLTDDEWTAIRDVMTDTSNSPTIQCGTEWLAELDSIRSDEV